MSERMFMFVVYAFLILAGLGCLVPFWIVVIDSFASEKLLNKGYVLFPSEYSMEAYRYLFKSNQIFKSYGVTVTVTLLGTILGVFVTAAFAYVIAHRKAKFGNFLSMMTYLPMVFGSGLVGFYLLIVNWLHMKDTMMVMILPYVMNPFFAFIFVTYFRSLPYEINESATVDGANEWRIFFQIIRPISTPVITTVSLFFSLQYWNDWWLGLLFIDNTNLYPLQILLRQILNSQSFKLFSTGVLIPPAEGLKLAMVCVTIGPIVFAYPFVQKYFVKGLTLGSVKG
ncbi:carbohydrate ABC transporter permease [Paenibacillus sacheonensis]|uniref:ABC transporter permease subunit n=1 Tax=Paenibacillus sacheonensis TaxID=742054 RepID=A0A7X4YL70_9BACL|nr:carbohydrate ABC transporter permease [Paenibacillus sacheonensis]MBM7568741.1 multiple sugar transport system permease protein/putative aldouronate transport system permease protein [Paenibacillus sacheonensis]NBC68420.1 ABC transporter permease subunit [Paenibacillus sacheonensis]